MGLQNQSVSHLGQQGTTSRGPGWQETCIFRSNERPMNKVSDLPTVLRDMLQPSPSVLPPGHQHLKDKKAVSRALLTFYAGRLGHLLLLFFLAVCVTSVAVKEVASVRPDVPSVVTSCASSSGGSYSCQLQDTGGEWDVGAESVFRPQEGSDRAGLRSCRPLAV